MKLLKDFRRFGRYIESSSKQEHIDNSLPIKIAGWFCELENAFSSLYLKDDALHFSFNETNIIIDSDVTVKLSTPTLINSTSSLALYEKQFMLYEREKLLLSFKYTIDEFYQITMEEEEDFDWGLFVSNIINVPKRKKQILEFLK
ncbi:hypothetical protein [Dysgonomonas sp. 25]|uniref:hypothetical protein n=1 Tax=Dysgonomonas sp. 25 TaxID=2302933 RepID=UPI0013D7BA4D|nr:hypothetical protein [Dysgonomonas sp. 25]NDV68509.1 hypothetical protein [Dysgonomonas sp. 25]